jgi:hypothetical protein
MIRPSPPVTGQRVEQSAGDYALPPSGLSQSPLSQAKPAAAIAGGPTIKVGQLYGCPKGEGAEFPIAFFEPHREQAHRNHGQSLERLAERGGLGWGEAIAITMGNDNHYTNVASNRKWLRAQFERWKREAGDAQGEAHD